MGPFQGLHDRGSPSYMSFWTYRLQTYMLGLIYDYAKKGILKIYSLFRNRLKSDRRSNRFQWFWVQKKGILKIWPFFRKRRLRWTGASPITACGGLVERILELR